MICSILLAKMSLTTTVTTQLSVPSPPTSPVVVVVSPKQYVSTWHGWCSVSKSLLSASLHLCLLLSETWAKCWIQSFSWIGYDVPNHCLWSSLFCRDTEIIKVFYFTVFFCNTFLNSHLTFADSFVMTAWATLTFLWSTEECFSFPASHPRNS